MITSKDTEYIFDKISHPIMTKITQQIRNRKELY